jgi:CGNR zinc finger
MSRRGLLATLFLHAESIGPALRTLRELRTGGLHPDLAALDPILEAVAEYLKHNTRKCERHDCPVVFVKTNGQRRFFCSKRCAHLVAVRNFRKRNDVTGRGPRKRVAA